MWTKRQKGMLRAITLAYSFVSEKREMLHFYSCIFVFIRVAQTTTVETTTKERKEVSVLLEYM